jgi:hypothetical protein
VERWAARRARFVFRQAVLRYVTHGWDVVPGAYLLRPAGRRGTGAGGVRCSCRNALCPAPGAHPFDADWQRRASRDPETVSWWWSAEPHSVLLPTGSTFDVFDVPARTGGYALRLWLGSGAPVGPVARTRDRWLFFSAPGGTPFPELEREHGVGHRGQGGYVVAPPTRAAGAGTPEWVRPPSPQNRRLAEASVAARVLREASELARSDAAARAGRRLRPGLRLRVAHVR